MTIEWGKGNADIYNKCALKFDKHVECHDLDWILGDERMPHVVPQQELAVKTSNILKIPVLSFDLCDKCDFFSPITAVPVSHNNDGDISPKVMPSLSFLLEH